MPANIVFAGIVPHPPLLIPVVGGNHIDEVSATVEGMREMAGRLRESGAEAIVIMTPHSSYVDSSITVLDLPDLQGDLSSFGAPQAVYKVKGDRALAGEILNQANLAHVAVNGVAPEAIGAAVRPTLDHGIIVFLHYLHEAGVCLPTVALSIGLDASLEDHYVMGEAVQKAAIVLDRKLAFIASGDLSHRLTPSAPAGYSPRAHEFDEAVTDALSKADPVALVSIDPDLRNEAGECGYRSAMALLGAVNGLDVEAVKLSYEGPYGVGYLNLYYHIKGLKPERNLAAAVYSAERFSGDVAVLKGRELLTLARRSVESYVVTGEKPADPDCLAPHWRQGRSGAFVCIKREGELRGCIGTVYPTENSIADEVCRNAISAASSDPRFPLVSRDELGLLSYAVDLLHEPEPVSGLEELDPFIYGVVVKSGARTGLLLPALEGIDTAEEQVDIARRKAGIRSDEEVQLWRFKVDRYEE
ncbi:MAG: AmmeMemoRadiSam system protein A [bacterium]|nr:AmmeMemoRadiSam system protein A [bacterium]